MRIVSLCPAATETLCLVGGSSLLVGRTHACGLAESVTSSILDRPVLTAPTAACADSMTPDPRPGAAWSLAIGPLTELAPDVVLVGRPGMVEPADLERAIAALPKDAQVVSFAPTTMEDIYEDALMLGRVIGRENTAVDAVVGLRERFYRACEFVTPYEEGPSVVALDWLDPLIVSGWWTPQLVERAGATFPLNPTVAKEGAGAAAGYAHTERLAGAPCARSVDELLASGAEALVVCCGGMDLAQVREAASSLPADLPAVRDGRVALLDGRRGLAVPGPGLVGVFEWLVGWLNGRPELMDGAGVRWEDQWEEK